MAARRISVFLAGALTIGVGAAWVASDSRPASPNFHACRPDVAYAVDVHEDQATFDLPFETGTRYRVIIASLASQEVESHITLSAEPVSEVEQFPLRPLPKLQPAIPRQFNLSWKTPELDRDFPFISPMDAPAERASHPPERSSASPERRFFLHVTDGPLEDPRQYAQVTGRQVAEGQFVRVFLDSQMKTAQLAAGLVPEIVRLFDENIVPSTRKVLGEFRDVDGDGKFAILISPWLGKLQGGQTSLGGFVRGSDFQSSVQAPFGNQADVMYLNANLRPGRHLHALLAHEFAHAVCFSERLPTMLHPAGLPAEEDWLNEAIAHLAENLQGTGWSNLDHRVSQFLDAPQQSPLVVPNYYADGLWRDPGCRGATFLFLRWVVDQFGEEVLARLVHSPGRGVRNLETATGVPFAVLFRHWSIALAQAGRQAPQAEGEKSGEFTSLDLAEPLGRWGLAGTRTTPWPLDGEPQTLALKGTTVQIFDLQAKQPGAYRLRIRSQGQPQLLLTVIRQPHDWPKITASAQWEPSESPATNPPALKVCINPSSDQPIKTIRLVLECRQGKHGQSYGTAVEPVDAGTVQEIRLEPPDRLSPPLSTAPAQWQLKIVAEDDKGRRANCWVDLPTPPSSKPIPFAEKPAQPVL